MKAARHARLLEIIANNEIETQEELVKALVAEGFKATQATVSRDIKDLRLTKIPDERGGYKYASVDSSTGGITLKMKQLFENSVSSIKCAQNIVVVKTLAGSANTIGVVVDALRDENILGSVAGDDTIIVVLVDNQAAIELVEKLNNMLK